MCDVIDLGKLLSQNKNEEKNNNTQDDAALPEFLQGGIIEGEEWFLTNTETGKRARFISADEIEEVEEAKVLDFFKPKD